MRFAIRRTPLLLLAVLVAAGAGCSASLDSGSLHVRLVYGDNTAGHASPAADLRSGIRSPYVHDNNNVIVIRVLAPHIAPPKEGTFRRSARRGEIANVPAGERIVVEVDEFDPSGTTLRGRGWTQGISLSPGQLKDVEVTMYAKGDIVRVCGADNSAGPGGQWGYGRIDGTIGVPRIDNLAKDFLLFDPRAVKVGPDDSVYVASTGANRVLKIDRYGYINNYAGNGLIDNIIDGQLAVNSPIGPVSDLDILPSGNLFLITLDQQIVRIDPTNRTLIKIYGQSNRDFSFVYKADITARDDNTIYYSNGLENNIYLLQGGIRTSFIDNSSGTQSGEGIEPHNYSMRFPSSVSFLPAGPTLLFADRDNCKIKAVLLVLTSNPVWTFIGDNAATPFYEGVDRLQMTPFFPISFDVDNYFGNYFFRERDNHGIRVLRSDSRVYNFAGTGAIGYSGDGGPATSAKMYDPRSVAVDSRGNVYIADTGNNALRVVIGGALP